MQRLALDLIQHRQGDVGAVLGRVDGNADRALTERPVDAPVTTTT